MGKYKTKYVGVLEKIDANNVKVASPPVFRIISPIYLPYFSQKIINNPIFLPYLFPTKKQISSLLLLILQWEACCITNS